MPIGYEPKGWHGSDTAPNAPETVRLRDAVAGLLDSQTVAFPLGADLTATRVAYGRSPGYETEVTGVFATAGSDGSGGAAVAFSLVAGATTVASLADIRTGINGAFLPIDLSATPAHLIVPANTRLVLATSGNAGSGGANATAIITFRPTGN
jgi:hypothetical protein